jgi:Acyl-CoA hydrolase
MRFMDSTAGIVAQQHSLCNPVTVSVDELVFQEKIKVGDLIVCEAELVFTGRTSMGIKVRVKKKNFKTEKSDKYAIEGNWLMVALDENRRPIPVPPLIIESPEQQKLFDAFKAKLIKKDER